MNMQWKKKRNLLAGMILLVLILFPTILESGTLHYTYDSAGQLLQADLGNGKTIIYDYDLAGNCIRKRIEGPCYDWPTFVAHASQWPASSITILTLVTDTQCAKSNEP